MLDITETLDYKEETKEFPRYRNFSIFPIVMNRALFFFRLLISLSRNQLKRPIKKFISFSGLFQFSVEKVYNVKNFTPKSSQLVTIDFTTSAPFLCPAILGSFFALAQRPFPSIIIAICVGACCVFITVNLIQILQLLVLIRQLTSCRSAS